MGRVPYTEETKIDKLSKYESNSNTSCWLDVVNGELKTDIQATLEHTPIPETIAFYNKKISLRSRSVNWSDADEKAAERFIENQIAPNLYIKSIDGNKIRLNAKNIEHDVYYYGFTYPLLSSVTCYLTVQYQYEEERLVKKYKVKFNGTVYQNIKLNGKSME